MLLYGKQLVEFGNYRPSRSDGAGYILFISLGVEMRLLIKITGAVLLGLIVLLVIDGLISIQRDVELYDRDMASDELLLGRTMKALVATAWETSGSGRALELISEANRNEPSIELRWVWLDAPPGDPYAPKLPPDKLTKLAEKQEFSYKQTGKWNVGFRYTYVIVLVEGTRVGALELSEPLTALRDYAYRTLYRTTVLTAGMLLLTSIIIWLLGLRYVGRPLDLLVEKTRRVGAGDFSGDLALPGKAELSNLATALNEMCRQLEAARETLRRETEARIDALEQLRHAERLATVGRLASGVAHELGTPLNVVAGRAKIIATENLDPEEIVAFSKTIAEQANRMAEIIRHLLDFARRRTSQRAPSDMAQLANQVFELITVTARKSNVSLKLEKVSDLPPVNIDRSQIQQVLVNLIMNGIQAMPEGGRLVLALSVEKVQPANVQHAERKDFFCIRVKDEGEGIPPGNINLVFDPFFTTKGVGKGTGLGLSISYGIVEEHGGWIDVQSELGKGSCFTVFLPLEERS
jgi:two-component system NtrC family sensor kinase